MKGKTVYVLVDNPWVLQVLNNLFAKAGADVHGSTDIEQGLVQLSQCQPDLVIADLGLSDSDGSGICARIRAACRAPVIILTPLAWESVCDCVQVNAVDWILKPFHPQALLCRAGERLGVPQPAGSTCAT